MADIEAPLQIAAGGTRTGLTRINELLSESLPGRSSDQIRELRFRSVEYKEILAETIAALREDREPVRPGYLEWQRSLSALPDTVAEFDGGAARSMNVGGSSTDPVPRRAEGGNGRSIVRTRSTVPRVGADELNDSAVTAAESDDDSAERVEVGDLNTDLELQGTAGSTSGFGTRNESTASWSGAVLSDEDATRLVDAGDSARRKENAGSDGSETLPQVFPVTPESTMPEHRHIHGEEEIRRLLGLTEEMEDPVVAQLNILAHDFLEGRDVSVLIREWVDFISSSYQPSQPRRRNKRERKKRRRRRRLRVQRTPARKQLRRREYARMQELWKKDLSKAAKLVLDGEVSAVQPSMDDMLDHWRPVLERPSPGIEPYPPLDRPNMDCLEAPITIREVERTAIPSSSAPGCDKITFPMWRRVPSAARALFFNIILALGAFPPALLVSRTVFVPKKDGSSLPSDFRPISIATVVVRHLHKILVRRLIRTNIIDKRQRGLVDGCAENITVLSALIADARARLREIHILVTDIAKAFDSVSHHAIRAVLEENGIPARIVNYISTVYDNSATKIEVGKDVSPLIQVLSGVRQGDPLSSWIFALVMDKVIRAVPTNIGYRLEGEYVNELLYADDEIKVASSRAGMQTSLLATEREARRQGLHLHPSKCFALSLVPVGKQRKMRVMTDPTFKLSDGSVIRQLGPSELWTYLGVQFSSGGVHKPSRLLATDLDKISSAPLKPQQRLKILRCFLVPRYYHQFILAKCSARFLKAMDCQIYVAIRRWLRLPRDVPIAYFHAPCRDGGLGIPSFRVAIPCMVFDRLTALQASDSPVTRAAANNIWTQRRLRWATGLLERSQPPLINKDARAYFWRNKLYAMTDGRELRESYKASASTAWIDRASHRIPGRDYVQYHRVHVNALPSRVRTTRGRRTEAVDLHCRAGCPRVETTAHVIQECFRTHGGRVKRHNAVSNTIAALLRDQGWAVDKEPTLNTSVGPRKPDIVAARDGNLVVVDSQIVSGVPDLNYTFGRKVAKYNITPVRQVLTEKYKVPTANIKVGACTISWRGVWAAGSVQLLRAMGVSVESLGGITTRVLQGSSTNWNRWSTLTTTYASYQGPRRTGVG